MDWYSGLFLLEPRARGLLRYTADAPGMNLSFSNSRTGRVATRGRSLDHIGFEVDPSGVYIELTEGFDKY